VVFIMPMARAIKAIPTSAFNETELVTEMITASKAATVPSRSRRATQTGVGQQSRGKVADDEEYYRERGMQRRRKMALAGQGAGLCRIPAHEGHVNAQGNSAVAVHVTGDQG
jgi:hypothetical protein